jgi:hypothetical protein
MGDWQQVQVAHKLLLRNLLGLQGKGPALLVSVQRTDEGILVKARSEADATISLEGSDQKGQGSLEVLLPATASQVEARAIKAGKSSLVIWPLATFTPD